MHHANHALRRAGFTLIELMLAVTISMILLYAAIFTASEAMAVVSEGDIQMHTQVQARRALDRILQDTRYASEVLVNGTAQTGWTVQVLTTGSLSPGWVTYAWDAQTGALTVATNAGSEWMLEGVRAFDLGTTTAVVNNATVVTALTIQWTVGLDGGAESGEGSVNGERETVLAGSARLRIHDA